MAKPYPIPVLDRIAFAEFERQIKKDPTPLQSEMMEQGIAMYNKIEQKNRESKIITWNPDELYLCHGLIYRSI